MNIDLNNEMNNEFIKEFDVDTGCNHDPNSPTTSLVRISKRTMVYPEKVSFLCTKCRKSFSFIRLNGKYTK